MNPSYRWNRFSIALLVSLTFGTNVAAAATTFETYGALAYYRMNDTDGILRDATARRLDGAYGRTVTHNAPSLTTNGDVTSTFPGGYYDGSRFAEVAPDANLQPRSAVSVEMWIREATASNAHGYIPLVAYGKHSQGSAYILMISPQNAIQFYVHTADGGFNLEGFTIVRPGVPYHIAATYDGHNAYLYVNGTLDGSLAATGAIEYERLRPTDGLGIGGSPNSGSSQFRGDIGHVAIYGGALTAKEVRSHYTVSVPPLILTERPNSTNAFVDSIGLNTHLHYQGTVYDSRFRDVARLLVDSGVRHIRDGLVDVTWPAYYDRLNMLGRAGIKSTLVTSVGETPALIRAYPGRVADTFEAYEPPNELDLNGGRTWVATLRAFQKMLYTTVKQNPSTSRFTVYGPALTALGPYEAIGDLSAYMDVGNFHEYFPGYNPGTDGFGAHTPLGIVGSIDWNMNATRIIDGSKPLAATETGYNYVAAARGGVSSVVGVKYVPRLLFEMFNRGVKRSFIYQLMDFEGEPTFQCGLVSMNMVPKPQYYALRSLISLLKTPTTPARTTPFTYTLSGNLSNLHHSLLERGDGSLDLVLWVETRSATPTLLTGGGSAIVIAPQPITIRTATVFKAADAVTIDGTGGVVPVVVRSSSTQFSLDVGDSVTVVHLRR